MAERPNIVDTQMLDFLDEYRKTKNPYGARGDLKEAFDLNNKEASTILKYWMDTFTSRHIVKALYPEGSWKCVTCGDEYEDIAPFSKDGDNPLCEFCHVEAEHMWKDLDERCPDCGHIESGCHEVGCLSEEWTDEDTKRYKEKVKNGNAK